MELCWHGKTNARSGDGCSGLRGIARSSSGLLCPRSAKSRAPAAYRYPCNSRCNNRVSSFLNKWDLGLRARGAAKPAYAARKFGPCARLRYYSSAGLSWGCAGEVFRNGPTSPGVRILGWLSVMSRSRASRVRGLRRRPNGESASSSEIDAS